MPAATTTSTDICDPANLANVLAILVRRQLDQEATSRKVVQWSCMVSALTYSQTRRLFEEQRRLQGQIIAGRAALCALQHHVDKQDANLLILQDQQESTQHQLEQVQKELQGQLDEHQATLALQASQVDRLTREKLQRGIFVESFILSLAAVASQSSLISIPISFMTFPMAKGKLKSSLATSLRLAAFASMAYSLRKRAIQAGLVSERMDYREYVNLLSA